MTDEEREMAVPNGGKLYLKPPGTATEEERAHDKAVLAAVMELVTQAIVAITPEHVQVASFGIVMSMKDAGASDFAMGAAILRPTEEGATDAPRVVRKAVNLAVEASRKMERDEGGEVLAPRGPHGVVLN